VQTVKDMGTASIIAISNRDALKTQVTTWQTSATESNDLVMSDVSSVVQIVLRITRNIRPTKTCKRKHTYLSVWNNTLLPHKSNKPYTRTFNQE
jgi:hypothetical protein